MASINKVILIGRTGRDAELRYTADGKSIALFSMATTETWKDGGGNKQERIEWHNITSWNKQAEFVAEYIKKGTLVYVEGRIQSREYVGRDGTTKKHYGIEASKVLLLALSGTGRNAPSGGHDAYADSGHDGFTKETEDDDIGI